MGGRGQSVYAVPGTESGMTMDSIGALPLQNDRFSLREFLLFGDGFTLDGFALDGFFLFVEGGTLDSIAHHVGFALEACALG